MVARVGQVDADACRPARWAMLRQLRPAPNSPCRITTRRAVADRFERQAERPWCVSLTSSSAGGRSVQTPSNSSAAMPIDSPSVGCGWMVLPMSAGSQPISMARQTSLIRSPACVPTMPPPIDAVRGLVEQQLGEAFVAAVGDGAARRGPGEHRLADLDAFGLALLLGLAGPGDFGIGVGHRRNLPRVEVRLLAVRGFGGHVRFVHRLVRQHRLADDVADGEDVRHVGAHLLVDLDEAAVGHRDAGLVGADLLAVRACGRPPPAPGRRPAAPSAPSRLRS